MKPIFAAAALFAAAGLGAQAGQTPVFQETQGDFKLFDMPSYEAELMPGKGWVVEGTGSPLRGVSPSRGLEFSTRRIKAEFDISRQGLTTFRRGEFNGDVRVNFSRTSGEGSDALSLQAGRAVVNDGANQADISLPSAFTFRSEAKPGAGAAETITGRASSGSFVLSPLTRPEPSGGRLRQASLKGGVKVSFLRQGKDRDSVEAESDELTLTRRLSQGAVLTRIASPRRLVLNQAVAFAPGGSQLRRSIDLTAASGEAEIESRAQGEARIRSLDLTGPVEIAAESDSGGEPKLRTRQTVKANGARVTAKSTPEGGLQIEFTGGVSFRYDRKPLQEGGPDPVGYAAQADRLTLVMDAQGEILSVKAGRGSAQTGGGQR